ncbi:MAG: TIGR00266 family protein [Candidatus Sericytochromatia bacterium]
MKSRIIYSGTNAALEFYLNKGESIKAESDAMLSMSATMDVDGKMEGGILGGLGRMMSGEKFFFQTLRASRGDGHVLVAPSKPGDIALIELDGSTEYQLQKDGFLAGSEGVQVSAKVQNLMKGLFSGEGFFILKASGRGTLAVSSFGAIHEINLGPAEEIIIDNDHLVAWPSTTSYNIEKASSGWISSFTSGEGFVCRFRGPGKVLIQSRNINSFASWIKGYVQRIR